jgi:hypothetical protein
MSLLIHLNRVHAAVLPLVVVFLNGALKRTVDLRKSVLQDLTKADQEEFQRYFEKTVDTAYRFAPSPEESTRIALKTAVPTNKQLAEHCITLGISNIRVIKKIDVAPPYFAEGLALVGDRRPWLGDALGDGGEGSGAGHE